MIASQSAAMEAVRWERDDGAGGEGVPLSPRFGQAYRSRSGALAQARTVFLGGCGLPARWQGAPACTVLELGFGLGLNFLATWAAWLADPRRSAALHYAAIEAWPVHADDLLCSARAAQPGAAPASDAAVPSQGPAPGPGSPRGGPCAHEDALILPLAQRLAEAWPALRPGLQTWELAHGDAPPVRLTLAQGEVGPMLAALDGLPPVQAVYLDGFSPAVNPAMWSPAVLQAVAARCSPDARLATYSAARAVRDALSAGGFEVWRRPGLPPKRHRLEARRLGAG